MGKTLRGLLDKPFFHLILITTLGLLAYSNTFDVPFQFDDTSVIVENPIIKDIQYFKEPAKVKEFVASNVIVHYTFKTRFIGYLTFALNYKIHGLDVTGYHIINISIHLINALLVYWFVVLTFKTPYFKVSVISTSVSKQPNQFNLSTFQPFNYLPLFVALLFVSHPIQTQAVTYIWQRITSLATMFYLLSLVMYIKFRMHDTGYKIHDKKIVAHASVLWYLASIFSAILAMKTKEISFTLPFIIALYEFCFFKGKIKRRSLYLIPLILTMLIVPLSRVGIDKPLGDLISDAGKATKELTTMSRWNYLFTQFRVVVTYIRLLFFPISQNIDYDYPIYTSFFNPNVFLSFLFLLSIFGFGVYLFYRSRFTVHSLQFSNSAGYTLHPTRLIAFGIFWFFITLSIESSIIPIADVIFEHRIYLPSIGAFIVITTSLFIVSTGLKDRWLRIKKAAVPVFTLIILVLLGTTYARNAIWKDEIILWEDVVKKSPKNARASYALGMAYQSQGFIDKAVEQYQIAIRLNPDYPEAYNSLGNAYLIYGWIDKTIEYLQFAIALKPDFAEAHYNLGNAYYKAKNLTIKAIEQYQIAITLKPDLVEAHYNLGLICLEKGAIADAQREFETVLLINPNAQQAQQFLSYISNLKSK